MKKITFLLLFVCHFAYTQDFQWVQRPAIDFSSNGDLIGYNTACDASGNVYFAGFKDDAFHYNETMGNSFFNKYSADGILLFEKTFTGHVAVNEMVCDAQGNVVVALSFVASVAIDGTELSSSAQGVHNALFKFDANGQLIWHRQFALNQWSEPEILALATDATGNLYAAYHDFLDSKIEKISIDGTTLMTLSQPHVRMVSSLSVDSQGNIYAAGSCAEWGSDFNGLQLESPFDYNTFLVKYSPEGSPQWVRFIEDITCPKPEVVAVTPDEVYFSSYLFGTPALDDLSTEGPVSMFADFFLAQLNSEGTFQWVREVPGNGMAQPGNRRFLWPGVNGEIVFAGSTRGAINWSDSWNTSSQGTIEDALLLKYDKQGNLLMAQTAGGAANDRIDAICVGPTGAVYTAGLARGTATFGALVFAAQPDQYWPFLARLDHGLLATNVPELKTYGWHPNPATHSLFISGTDNVVAGAVFNALGQKLFEFAADRYNPIDVSALSSGSYLVKSQDGSAFKLIKN